MRPGPGWRWLTWGLVAVLLLEGCATVPVDGGGGGWTSSHRGPRVGGPEWEALAEARRAEVESALLGMWGVASGVREVGAVLEFTFWAEGGALTLLSLRRRERGGAGGRPIDRETFTRELRAHLPTYVEGHTGTVVLRLRREEGRWRADYETAGWEGAEDLPQEAKTWPVGRVGVRAETFEALLAADREALSRLWVPAGGAVSWRVEVALEDERVRGLETRPPRALPGGVAVKAATEAAGTLLNVLVPFSQGLGPRKVRVELEGVHAAGARAPHWRVVAAEVVRPPPPTPQNVEVAAEYRRMHEGIQRQWREETREGFEQMGLFTLEQLALWFVGGLVARGAAVFVEAVAPTVARVMAQGGSRAVGWFRSLLARAAPAEKQTLSRLMVKVETQGLEALTLAERKELQTILGGLEKRLAQPLSEQAKGNLRGVASDEFYERLHPELARVLVHGKARYPVHHKLPLEFAHLFPLEDINAAANLVAVNPRVHQAINGAWNVFRAAKDVATPRDVKSAAARIDRHFGRWYNRTVEASEADERAIQEAEEAARREIRELVEHLVRGRQ